MCFCFSDYCFNSAFFVTHFSPLHVDFKFLFLNSHKHTRHPDIEEARKSIFFFSFFPPTYNHFFSPSCTLNRRARCMTKSNLLFFIVLSSLNCYFFTVFTWKLLLVAQELFSFFLKSSKFNFLFLGLFQRAVARLVIYWANKKKKSVSSSKRQWWWENTKTRFLPTADWTCARMDVR